MWAPTGNLLGTKSTAHPTQCFLPFFLQMSDLQCGIKTSPPLPAFFLIPCVCVSRIITNGPPGRSHFYSSKVSIALQHIACTFNHMLTSVSGRPKRTYYKLKGKCVYRFKNFSKLNVSGKDIQQCFENRLQSLWIFYMRF